MKNPSFVQGGDCVSSDLNMRKIFDHNGHIEISALHWREGERRPGEGERL